MYDECKERGFPVDVGMVGRLDTDTSGLIMFTDDARLNKAISSPYTAGCSGGTARFHQKEYVVTVKGCRSDLLADGALDLGELEREMAAPLTFSQCGYLLSTQPAQSVRVEALWREPYQERAPLGTFTADVAVILCEGKNHQVRRTCHRSGLKVKALRRRTIATVLRVESVSSPGDVRWLTTEEAAKLYVGVGMEVRNL